MNKSQMRATKNSSVNLLSIIGLGLLPAIILISYWSANKYQETSRWRGYSARIIAKARELQVTMESSVSLKKSLLLTKSQEAEKKFQETSQKVPQILEHLRQNIKESPFQISVLDSIQMDFNHLLEMMTGFLMQKPSLQTQQALIQQEHLEEKQLEKIRASFAQLENDALSLVHMRTQTAERQFFIVFFSVAAGQLLAFTLILLTLRFLRRELRVRNYIEEALRQERQKAIKSSDLKSIFLANMSHEIRTPLNGIIGMTTLLKRTELNPRQSEFIDTIHLSSTSLLALINQLLDLSKIESGKMQLEESLFELHSLLQSTLSIVDYTAKEKGLNLEINLQENIPHFYMGDSLRIRQVILNLLNNAIKFSEHGTIRLKVSCPQQDKNYAHLLFEVSDQGVGMDQETQGKLFKAFTQGDASTSRRYGGTGLGLFISRQIVELMGGKINVDSVPGQGSKFFFDLHLKKSSYEKPQSKELAPESKSTLSLAGRILIVEDNRINQRVVSEMLTLIGCGHEVAENGAVAIEFLQKNSQFDLILMDAQMPVVDGYEATQRIRQGEAGPHYQHIPIIATTANAIKSDVEKCLAVGMNDYIAKPLSLDDLALKLNKWLAKGKNPIDESAIKKLEALSAKVRKDIVAELVDVFKEDSEIAKDRILAAYQQRNYPEVAKWAHTLKSSCANLGIVHLREIVSRIEVLAHQKSEAELEHLVYSLSNGVAIAKKALDDYAQQKKLKSNNSQMQT